VRVQYYTGTCNLKPITAYHPIDGINRLLTKCAPDWQAWDVAPPISLAACKRVVIGPPASYVLHVVTLGVGDGGGREGTCPPKIRENMFRAIIM